jgi:small subunit ribosomal protein S15
MLTPRKKKIIIKEHAAHDTDTGSTAVQIALVSRSIDDLALHLRKNPKDNHSRRGLLQMVGKRRRLLDYLSKTDAKVYVSVVKKLDLKR